MIIVTPVVAIGLATALLVKSLLDRRFEATSKHEDADDTSAGASANPAPFTPEQEARIREIVEETVNARQHTATLTVEGPRPSPLMAAAMAHIAQRTGRAIP